MEKVETVYGDTIESTGVYTTGQVAKIFRCSPQHVVRQTLKQRTGRLKCRLVPGGSTHRRFDGKVLIAYIKRNCPVLIK